MRRFLQIIILLTFSTNPGGLLAQDAHFSQFYATPLQINPAMTGVFDGKLRLSNSYRSQWSGLGPAYKTFHLSADVPVAKALMQKNKFFGVGFLLYQDKAGAASFAHTIIEGSLSFITALDDVGDHFISFGFQGGLNQSSIDLTKTTWDSQWNGDKFDPSLPSYEGIPLEQFTYLDMNAGVQYYYVPDGLNTISFGGSLSHINKPTISFYTNGETQLRRKMMFNGSGDIVLNTDKTAWIDPRFMMAFQGNQKEIMVGGYFKNKVQFKSHYTNYKRDAYFYLGGFYRFNDAAVISARFEYNSVGLGLSYDFNTSNLSTLAGSANAIEINFAFVMGVKRGEVSKNYNKMPKFL